MSLVEQAIARLRNQQSGAQRPVVGGSSPRSVVPPAVGEIDESKAVNRLVIDFNALRAGGYLPEASKDRQFADHYRRIKRPLIEKALSGEDAAGEPRVIIVASEIGRAHV